MRGRTWIVLAGLAGGLLLVTALGARHISDGSVFPDGSVIPFQDCPTLDPSDEMLWVGGVCIDKYEASIWDAPTGGNLIPNGTSIPCDFNGQDCDNIWARSVAGVEPRHSITWFQAQQALANSGKRLPTNAEWQMVASGTPDPDDLPGSEDCNTVSTVLDTAGQRVQCVSRWGAYDMVGNLWEWVADWEESVGACTNQDSSLNFDVSCFGRGDGEGVSTHKAVALYRGGDDAGGTNAGVFAIASTSPQTGSSKLGFRGAR